MIKVPAARETLAIAQRFLRRYDEVFGPRHSIPDWKLLQRIAIRAEPKLRRDWVKAVGAALNGTVQKSIESRLEAGDIDGAVAAVPWDSAASPVIRDNLMTTFLDTYQAAGNAALVVVQRKDRFPFSIEDDRPLRWIEAHGGELVSHFGLENEAGLRSALTSMMKDGLTPQQASKLIREHVGLSEPFAKAVENRRMALAKDGDPRLEQKVASYAKELRAVRSDLISKQESAMATWGAQEEARTQAIDRGLLDPDRARKRVVTAGDDVVRDTHAAMEGQVRRLDEPFTTGDGRQVAAPPFDIGCRCGVETLPEGE